MINKVRQAIFSYEMLPKPGKVLVALSGGSDSMCLLSILNFLKTDLNITIEAAHVNHGIRGDEANRDMLFCKEQCEKMGITLHVKEADVPLIASQKGLSLEEAGRLVRYEFFDSLQADYVATAHNLSDRAETFIFNMVRGSSLKGLNSIPPVRDKFIRPLINCTKAEINGFCKENDIPYVTDSTNENTEYTRNRIRHNIIPELKKINPAFENSISKCIEGITEDEMLLSQMADSLLENSKSRDENYDIKAFFSAPKPIAKRAIAKIISKRLKSQNISKQIDSRMIDEVYGLLYDYQNNHIGRRVQLSGNLFAVTGSGLLRFSNENSQENIPSKITVDIQKEQNDISFGDYNIKLKLIPYEKNKSYKVNLREGKYYLDFNKVKGALVIRTRAENDSIVIGLNKITKPLRKYQNEKKIPAEIRNSLPVISDDTGILLAHKCGVSTNVFVDEHTNTVLEIII